MYRSLHPRGRKKPQAAGEKEDDAANTKQGRRQADSVSEPYTRAIRIDPHSTSAKNGDRPFVKG